MAGKRRHKRITKRLATAFSSEGSSFRGTSSNLSESGLFLRTTKPLPADTPVDVTIELPDDTVARLKGTVRWALKSLQSTWRSGMGIEISEYDRHYADFLNAFLPPEDQIVYKERKAVAEPSASKIEQSAPPKTGPVPRRESTPVPPPKAPPSAARESDHEPDDNQIDSLIFSLFSKPEKKQGE